VCRQAAVGVVARARRTGSLLERIVKTPDSNIVTTFADEDGATRVALIPHNVWRVGFAVLAVVAVGLFLRFVVSDAGSVMFTVLMAWFASIAMAPAVDPLARHMRRGLATGLVMGGLALFVVLFVVAFGQLFVDQVAHLLQALPDLIKRIVATVNERAGTDYKLSDILGSLNLDPSQVAGYAAQILGGVLTLVGTVVGSVFSLFTFALFTFYLSADAPRFRRWIASLFSQRLQPVVVSVWDVTAEKTGGYVAARVVLATINAATTAVVFLIIGMPSWLALALWTGIVAQFVPTIGTYIAIALPVLVGLLTPTPWIGVAALVWALLYQQVENLTIEPKISAKAVDVHPAAAFAFVMVGAALFGVAGALLAIPVGAMLIALGELYQKRHPLIPSLLPPGGDDAAPGTASQGSTTGDEAKASGDVDRGIPVVDAQLGVEAT
jgi:predicted PurR-regulated permease PerM